MADIRNPEVKSTLSHRFVTDTAIAWRTKIPIGAPPPQNMPQFPGQLIAVKISATTCKLYVGNREQTAWMEVV